MPELDESKEQRNLINLLATVLTLCFLDDRISTERLDQIIAVARQNARRSARRLRSPRRNIVNHDQIGHLIYQWQRTPAYLGDDGRPYPIPASGPAPSIEAIFKKLKMSGSFAQTVKQMRKLRRVRSTRDGLFLPHSEATIIPTLTPEVVEAVTQTIDSFVATILHNTSLKAKRKNLLIERAAFVPDLPTAKIAKFKSFAREQGGALLETVNDWLEGSREPVARRPNAKGTAAAGLHIFAFVRKAND
ncbi:MAG TPA: DUF6502 family protein [Steroidobacteraceae bacterium]|nr:DUF6502 family protein [Steroidobacteraceae bacterium]